MDIETLKEALGDEKFKALKTYVDDLTGQRDTARNESITGRKGIKAKLDEALARVTELEDWGGVEAGADLKELPPAKGAVEAAKQYDAKVKRLERLHLDEKTRADAADGKYRDTLKRAAVAEALGAHEFLERDVVESFVAQSLVWEGDDLLYKQADGKLIPVKDGVAGIAKTRPGLLKPTGTGGAGARQSNAGGGGGKTMARAEFDALRPAERAKTMAAGITVTDA